MSYVVMSNNSGSWDYDMIGAVGVVDNKNEFLSFVKQHAEITSGDVVTENAEIVVHKTKHDVARVLDENELSYFAAGSDEQIALIEEPDCYPAVYVLVKF